MSAIWQYLNELDGQLLLIINGWQTPFLSNFLYTCSGRYTWVLLYISIIVYCLIRWKKQGLWIIAATILCVVLADQFSAHLIKPLVCRLRPTHDPSLAPLINIVNDYRGGLYGFVSSHAANCFAVSTFVTMVSKNKIASATLFTWAAINIYSRMYLGVHYPGDIICGAILGSVIALILYKVLKLKKNFPIMGNDSTKNINNGCIIATAFTITILYVAIRAFYAL